MSKNGNVISDDKAEPWYAGGLEFACTQCGNCCTGAPGYVWISPEEIGRVAEHLSITPQEVIEMYCRKIGQRHSLDERCNSRGEHDCIFLREEKAPPVAGDAVAHGKRICAIYPVRPLQCRTWPFWEGNLSSQESWKRAGRRCPGIGRGASYTLARIELLRDARDWPDQRPA